MLGSITLGYYINRTKNFKTANVAIGISCIVSVSLLIGALHTGTGALMAAAALVGLSSLPVVTICYIYAAEISYPYEDITVSGIFTTFSELIGDGVAYLLLYEIREVNDEFGSVLGLLLIIVSLMVGTL